MERIMDLGQQQKRINYLKLVFMIVSLLVLFFLVMIAIRSGRALIMIVQYLLGDSDAAEPFLSLREFLLDYMLPLSVEIVLSFLLFKTMLFIRKHIIMRSMVQKFALIMKNDGQQWQALYDNPKTGVSMVFGQGKSLVNAQMSACEKISDYMMYLADNLPNAREMSMEEIRAAFDEHVEAGKPFPESMLEA